MRIRFLSNQVYEQGGPGRGPHFPEGFVLDGADVGKVLGLKEPPTPEWVEGFMNRWLQRQVAEVVDAKAVEASTTDKVGSGRVPKKVDLDRMTRAQLEALAKSRGIDVSKAKSRAEVLTAVNKAEKATK